MVVTVLGVGTATEVEGVVGRLRTVLLVERAAEPA